MKRAIIFILSILLFSSCTTSRVEELEAENEALKNELVILRAERDAAQQAAEVQMILALHQTEIARAATELAMLSAEEIMKRAEEKEASKQ